MTGDLNPTIRRRTPSSWKPQYIRDREEAAQIHPHELEMFLAAMDKRELTLLLQRIEQMR